MSQESLGSFRQYLLSLNAASDDKKYAMDFYKKSEYLESLKQEAINDLHCHISSGYGSVNSNICFIFPDEESLSVIKPLVQDVLKKLKINFWGVYTPFLNKSSQEYSKKYNYQIYKIDNNCQYKDGINYQMVYLKVLNLDKLYLIDGYEVDGKILKKKLKIIDYLKNKEEE